MIRLAAILALSLLPALAPAQDAGRAEKMVQLVENVNLPYIQRMFAVLIEETRREMPRKFTERAGSDGKLGEAWKPGNRYFDLVRARLEARFADGERNGRFAAPDRREIARTLRVAWTDEELDFLNGYVKTDAGKQILEFIDVLTVSAVRSALAKGAQTPAAFEPRTADIVLEATQRLGAIAANLGRLFETSKQDTERAMELVKKVDGKSGELIGQLWAGKLFVALISIVNEERLEIRGIIDEFRRAEGLPAPARRDGPPAPARL